MNHKALRCSAQSLLDSTAIFDSCFVVSKSYFLLPKSMVMHQADRLNTIRLGNKAMILMLHEYFCSAQLLFQIRLNASPQPTVLGRSALPTKDRTKYLIGTQNQCF